MLTVSKNTAGKPVEDRCPALLGDLKLDRAASFLLDHRGTVPYLAADAYVIDPQPYEVAAAQLAVDRKVEQSEIAFTPLKLEPDAYCPNLLWFQWTFLANQPALIPRASRKANKRRDRGVHGLSPRSRPRPPQHGSSVDPQHDH